MSAFADLDVSGLVLPQADTPCMARLADRTWHRTLAVRTGAWVVGVRANSPETAELIESWFAPLREPQLDGEVRPNLSVELHHGPAERRLQIIYRDSEIVGRRRTVEDALLDLTVLLDEGPRLQNGDLLALNAGGVLDPDGRVVLVPGRMHADLLTRRGQFEAEGMTVLHSRTALVDPATAEIELDLVDPTLAGIAASAGYVGGRHPVTTWCLPSAEAAEPFDLFPAGAVFHGCSHTLNRYAIGMGVTLRALERLTSQVRVLGLPNLPSNRLAQTVIGLASTF